MHYLNRKQYNDIPINIIKQLNEGKQLLQTKEPNLFTVDAGIPCARYGCRCTFGQGNITLGNASYFHLLDTFWINVVLYEISREEPGTDWVMLYPSKKRHSFKNQ